MIIVTRAFRKHLSGFSHRILDEIFSLIRKHRSGIETSLFQIEEYENYMILKGYIDGKRVRLLVAKQEKVYIPLALYKKESKEGFNIRADFDVAPLIRKADFCIENDEFETFDIR
jgi:hypothetical protein